MQIAWPAAYRRMEVVRMSSVLAEILSLIHKVDSYDDLRSIGNAVNARGRALQGKVAQQAVQQKGLLPGDPVSFYARGRTIVGTVKTINPKSVSVEPQGGGPHWRVAPSLLTKLDKLPEQKKKRSEDDLMAAILDCYGGLSPENLSCDGEASAGQVQRKSRELHSKLEELFRELGRRVSETEAYNWYQTKGCAAGVRGV